MTQVISAELAFDIRQRYAAFEAWRADRTVYCVEDIPSGIPQVTNEELSQLEVFDTVRDKPQKLFAYFKLVDMAGNPSGYTAKDVSRGCYCQVTTWTGEVLGSGRVTSFASWRSNMGDRRVAFRVDIAGTPYSGTAFLDAGDYARLRKVKA